MLNDTPLFAQLHHDPDATRETKAMAYAAAVPKQRRRRDDCELFVASCGRHGATRSEIAAALGVGDHVVSSPVRQLIDAGRLIDTDRRRATPTGSMAVVVMSAMIDAGEVR